MPFTAECPVCLEDFWFPEDGVFFLTCGHGICAGCSQLQQWMRCPTCRTYTFAGIHPPQRIFVQLAERAAMATNTGEPAAVLHGATVAGRGPVNAGVSGPPSRRRETIEDPSDENGADAEEAFEALEDLADIPHLDSTTKSNILHVVRILDRELRPSLIALRVERAELRESRAAMLVCVDQYKDRIQTLEGEQARLTGALDRTEIALRAAQRRAKDRMMESDFWNRRANELHREMLSRDKTVEDLRKKNYALALKLDEFKFGLRAEHEEKQRLLKELEDSQAQRRRLQLEIAEARETAQILRQTPMMILHRRGKARCFWESIKPNWENVQRPLIFLSLLLVYAMAGFLCGVMPWDLCAMFSAADEVAPEIESLIFSLIYGPETPDTEGLDQSASVEQAAVDDDEMETDAKAMEACDALRTLLEWPSFERDHRAKLVVRDAYVAVLHFRAAHMKAQNHRRQLLANLETRDVRVAALEDLNKRILEIRELTKKQLQASEQARKDKDKALTEYKRAKERELAERRNTQRVLEDNVGYQFSPLSLSIRSKRLDELYTEQQQAVAKLEEEVQTLRKDNAALRKSMMEL
ncbi:hypothetical protein K523DRAFT_353661 [Schizophyllum commune Tattone D]|nr:hypothetical protein K523DRAFT_353661 [Schizophyllum commune Tattone D]